MRLGLLASARGSNADAILTAIADLVPDKRLIAAPGSWSRNLHYQWISFVQSELEAFLQSTEVNSIDFIIPEAEHVPEIKIQNDRFFRKGAAVLNDLGVPVQQQGIIRILGPKMNVPRTIGDIDKVPAGKRIIFRIQENTRFGLCRFSIFICPHTLFKVI